MSQLQLVPILQTSISPAILISGIGLLLLTMTNRLGRAIDRARALATSSLETNQQKHGQLEILWRRARTLRWSIFLASLSALCAAFLIIILFVGVLLKFELAWAIVALFAGCMMLLIASVILFIHDINQSLEALRLVMRRREAAQKSP